MLQARTKSQKLTEMVYLNQKEIDMNHWNAYLFNLRLMLNSWEIEEEQSNLIQA
jgi:hypothetical protein